MGIRQVVRHWFLVPAFGGSNPSSPARCDSRNSDPSSFSAITRAKISTKLQNESLTRLFLFYISMDFKNAISVLTVYRIYKSETSKSDSISLIASANETHSTTEFFSASLSSPTRVGKPF